jgi:serine/threonine-protein kinase HipA
VKRHLHTKIDPYANSDHSVKFFGTPNPPELPYSYNDIYDLGLEIVRSRTSITGVQPKLSLSLNTTDKNTRLTIVGVLDGLYILKPPTGSFPSMPANELLTMLIAKELGINTVPFSFIKLRSGELCYITKRIDRSRNGKKIHMLDFYQILEAYDKYTGSYEKIAHGLKRYSNRVQLDLTYLFDIILCSLITGNADMHLKNFSMVVTKNSWGMAPAYDLLNTKILIPEDKEETALTLNGKKKNITKDDLLSFGENIGLTEKQVLNSFNRVATRSESIRSLIDESYLDTRSSSVYLDYFNKKISMFI